jgi:hypothetical protein
MDKLVKHVHASKRYSLARASKDVGAAVEAARILQDFTDQVHACLSAMTERQRHITMVSVACVIGGVPAVAAQFDALPPRKRKAKAKPRGR